MIDVHLHGRLAQLLPEPGPLRLAVAHPAEAVRAVCALLPGARAVLEAGEWLLTAGGEPVLEDTLGLAFGRRPDLHIHPAGAGAGPAEAAVAGIAGFFGVSSAAVVIGGATLLVSAWALTQVPDIADYDEREEAERRASYLYGGPVNRTAQGGRVPLIYGGPIRVGSVLVSAGIESERVQLTEPAGEDWDGDSYDGDRAYWYQGHGGGSSESRRPVEGDVTLQTRATLRAVDLLGEGPIRGLADGLRSVFIDGTPVQNADGSLNIEGVAVEQRTGTPDQAPLEGVPETVAPARFSAKVEHGAPVTRTIQTAKDSARVTLRFPQLRTVTKQGDTLGATVRFRIEVQPSGGVFAAVVEQTISDKTDGAAELSWRFPLEGDAPYTIRVTRTNADSTSDRVEDDLYWVGLDEIVEVRQTYPNSAVIGIVAEADKYAGQIHRRAYEVYGRIVAVPSNYDPATRAYTGLWDGTFTQAWTDNGAWIVYDILRHRRYGLGGDIAAARVEATKWELYSIARFNDQLVDDGGGGREPRFRFTGVISKAADAARVIAGMLSNFRAAHYYGAGAVVPFQDGPSDAVALVGAANVIDGEFAYGEALEHRQRVSAVAVTFSDPDDGYKPGIELVVDDELVAKYGWRVRDVAALYCTSRSQAHRQGRHMLIEQEHEGDTLRYRAGLDHASVRPGDVVRVADPGRGGERTACRIGGG